MTTSPSSAQKEAEFSTALSPEPSGGGKTSETISLLRDKLSLLKEKLPHDDKTEALFLEVEGLVASLVPSDERSTISTIYSTISNDEPIRAVYEEHNVLYTNRKGTTVQIVYNTLAKRVEVRKSIKLAKDFASYSKAIAIISELFHENLTRVYSCGTRREVQDSWALEIYMEPLLFDLRKRLESHLSLEEVLEMAVGVLRGLSYLHGNGLIHQDIKPENIGIRDQNKGIAKIMDLDGLRKLGEQGFKIVSTKEWQSPEQEEWRKTRTGPLPDHRTDIFSFGKVLQSSFKSIPESEVQRFPAVMTMLREVAQKAMERRPEDRFQSAEDMLLEIEKIALFQGNQELKPFLSSSWLKLPFVLDSDMTGYLPGNIRIAVSIKDLQHLEEGFPFDEFVLEAVPPKYKQQYREVRERTIPKWNNTIVAINRALVTRTLGEELHVLEFECSLVDYRHHRTMGAIFAQLETQQKARLTENLGEFEHPEFCTSMGTHITVLTGDNKILFMERSKAVDQSPLAYVCGAVETIDVRDIDKILQPNGAGWRGFINIHEASVRALREELGIVTTPDRITITGFMCKPDVLEWGFVGFTKADHLSFHDVEMRWATGVSKDKWENKKPIGVEFTPEAVFRFIKGHKEKVVSSGVACALFALRSRFPEKEILNALFTSLTS